jgi:hypothetical protein
MPSTPTDDDTVLDITEPGALDSLLEERHARRFSEEHVVDWLRSSGGPLADRIMKQLAADAIERSWDR